MKYLMAFAMAGAGACAAGPQSPRPADLRQTVQQYHPAVVAPAPRQLSARERAELRRQLAEQAQPMRRR